MSASRQRSGGEEGTTQVVYRDDHPVVVHRGTTLRVVRGPDQGASLAIGLRRVRVGTSADNDLSLSDPAISRHHLEFQIQDLGLLVTDLDTTNGTFYRGARVNDLLLSPGAELRLGETVLRIEPAPEQTQRVAGHTSFGGLIGSSPAMQQVYGLLATIAPADVTVLVQGETGTGKELVAEELHRMSPRARRPFSVVDCGSMPPNLIESELFGHQRGAFTGAVTSRAGVFERSHGGVVFLDEIGELPLELQTRLLRVLEQRQVKRIGGDRAIAVDVRVVAATNRDLAQEVDDQRFRRDLYYRLAVVTVKVPALRERPGDIPALARHFLWEMGCGNPDSVLKPDVLDILANRQWPGNVRELRNAVERAVLFADSGLRPFDSVRREQSVPGAVDDRETPAAAAQAEEAVVEDESDAWLLRSLPKTFFDQPYKVAKELLTNEFEHLYLRHLLERHGSNVSRMASFAEIDRRMVRKLLKKHGHGKGNQR